MDETNADAHQRLWTPWRMAYVGGERRPTPPGVSIFSAIASDPARDAENFVLYRGARAFVLMNLFPYNTGHCMVVPFRQVPTLADLDEGEATEIALLLPWLTRVLKQTLNCDGFNLGLNLGAVAGAGVSEHLHWHVVPRWQGDANFMPILAETTVMPELLPDTYAKIRATMAADPPPILGVLASEPVGQAGGVLRYGDRFVVRRAADRSIVHVKGHIEAGETPEQAAIREVEEETGLIARVVAPLGVHVFPYKRDLRRVTYFLMDVTSETPAWEEHRGKDALLLAPEEAEARLTHPESRTLLARARRVLSPES
jgi:ATP adenylyltransferase